MAWTKPAATEAPVTTVRLTDVVVPSGRRAVRDVAELADSIREVGLLAPIIVTPDMQLVAGGHRLEACRLLGWSTIPARVVTMSELHRELIEIDENVARVELSVLERAMALAKRRSIYHALHPEVRSVRERGGPGRGGKKTSATMAVVRPFAEDAAVRAGISTRTVWRSVGIAENLDPEAAKLLLATPTANSTTDLVRLSRLERRLQRDVARLLANGTRTIKNALRQLRWRKIRQAGSTPTRAWLAPCPWRARRSRQ
jgi:ParB family chromosome partitioning protein